MNKKQNEFEFEFKEPFKQCPICDSKKIKFAFNSNKTKFSLAGFSIYACENCLLYFCNPQPTKESLLNFYLKDMETVLNDEFLKINVNRYLDINKRETFKKIRLKFLQKYLKTGTILDCGCGVGVFVKILQDAGYSCDGFDISKKSIEIGKKFLGLSTLEYREIDDLDKKNKRYDAVLATTLIEHLADPFFFLNSVSKVLKNNGLLVLELPMSDSLSFETMQENWFWIMTPYHLFYYSRKAMQILLSKNNFYIVGEESLNPSWMWAESIANKLNYSEKYWEWRNDSDFVKYTIEIDKIFDNIAFFQNKSTTRQIYARKNKI